MKRLLLLVFTCCGCAATVLSPEGSRVNLASNFPRETLQVAADPFAGKCSIVATEGHDKLESGSPAAIKNRAAVLGANAAFERLAGTEDVVGVLHDCALGSYGNVGSLAYLCQNQYGASYRIYPMYGNITYYRCEQPKP